MENVPTVRALIDLWPTRRALAADIDVPADRVNGWAKTGSIPARYHLPIIEAGRAHGFEIDADLLVRLHALAAPRPDEAAA